MVDEIICELCERTVSGVCRHHLVPRKFSDNVGESSYLCRDCSKMVHAIFKLKELKTKYNTVEKLLANDEILKYVAWVKDKPEGIVKHPRRSWKGGKYE